VHSIQAFHLQCGQNGIRGHKYNIGGHNEDNNAGQGRLRVYKLTSGHFGCLEHGGREVDGQPVVCCCSSQIISCNWYKLKAGGEI